LIRSTNYEEDIKVFEDYPSSCFSFENSVSETGPCFRFQIETYARGHNP
jgi:hypothetical protein